MQKRLKVHSSAALIYEGFSNLRQKRLRKKTRLNIHRVRVRKVVIRGAEIENFEMDIPLRHINCKKLEVTR